MMQRLWRNLSLNGHLQLAQRWLLLPGPALLIFALIAPYNGLFFLAYTYILLLLGCYAWVRLSGPRIRLQRHMQREWAQVGDELREQWLLQNNSLLPLLWAEIEDRSTLPGYTGKRVVAAGGGEQHSWLTSALCTQRGVYDLGPLIVRTGDPCGIFRYQWRDSNTRRIVIYPPLLQLPALKLPQGQRGGLARADILQQYVTPSVGGLREYVQGDPPSHIHWPTVARTQRLMVKEFDQERAGALWIVLDLEAAAYSAAEQQAQLFHPSPAPSAEASAYTQSSVVARPAEASASSPLELAISLACSLAAQALAEGRSVGLLANDGRRRMVMPGQGPRQLWRILSELVDAQASGALALGEVLRQGHTVRATEAAGSALVVVTPALDGAWLPGLANWQRGRPGGALALLIAAQLEHAHGLEARLAVSGVAAHSFEVGVQLPLLTPSKPREQLRVSPLGKIMRDQAAHRA